jgi:hypothetical protein
MRSCRALRPWVRPVTRRPYLAVVLLGLLVVAAGCARADASPGAGHRAAAPRAGSPRAVSPAPTSQRPAPVSYPRAGGGRFRTAAGDPTVLGDAGTLLRFRVREETDIWHLPVDGVAATVSAILGARQGWTAGGDWRFRRVGAGGPADFTVWLVTPATRDRMCGDVPDGYTSCRHGDDVILNVSRWVHGVPYYPNLDEYRSYAVGHEVGHRLGHGHELCPGRGRRAPVMQQQTLGLHGCVPNPWPYPDGRPYHGVSGNDDERIPHDPPGWYRPAR